jgi:hypothetical protein
MSAPLVLRGPGDATRERVQAEHSALSELLARGQLLVETHGAGYEHTDPVDAAAVRYWLACECERALRTDAPVPTRTFSTRMVDGVVVVLRDGTELARCEPDATAIAGVVLRRELGLDSQRFSAALFARDFPGLDAGGARITSAQIRAWAEGQG